MVVHAQSEGPDRTLLMCVVRRHVRLKLRPEVVDRIHLRTGNVISLDSWSSSCPSSISCVTLGADPDSDAANWLTLPWHQAPHHTGLTGLVIQAQQDCCWRTPCVCKATANSYANPTIAGLHVSCLEPCRHHAYVLDLKCGLFDLRNKAALHVGKLA